MCKKEKASTESISIFSFVLTLIITGILWLFGVFDENIEQPIDMLKDYGVATIIKNGNTKIFTYIKDGSVDLYCVAKRDKKGVARWKFEKNLTKSEFVNYSKNCDYLTDKGWWHEKVNDKEIYVITDDGVVVLENDNDVHILVINEDDEFMVFTGKGLAIGKIFLQKETMSVFNLNNFIEENDLDFPEDSGRSIKDSD